MRKKQLVIIGNGMGTCRLLDELTTRKGTDRYDITVIGEEPGGAYNRIMLGKVLAGEAPDSIVTKPLDWYARHDIKLMSGVKVTKVDPTRKTIEVSVGDPRRYDVAVLATGSVPLVPPLEGMMKAGGELREGVFVYRTLQDSMSLRQAARAGSTAVVVGGGLLGLEAAKALSDLGVHVTIVHVAHGLMNSQLDYVAGQMLARQIERHGIFVRLGKTVESVYGDDYIEGVLLDDGAMLPADMLVLACGVRPRVDLARASGIPVNKGIIVNDALATELPGIYAFGECAEHNGKLYGIVAPVWEQATVLADVLTGANPQSRYRGSKLYARLKVAGVDVASMGLIEPELETDEVVQIVEERVHAYRKLIMRGGRLAGAMLVGNTKAAAALVQLFDRNDPMPEDPLEALCAGGGGGAAQDRTICNCHKVSESAICAVIQTGADSVEAVSDATRAGTGCGSCKGEIGQLITRLAKRPPTEAVAAAG